MTTLTLKIELEESLVLAYLKAQPLEKAAFKKQIEKLFSLQWRKKNVDEVHQRNVAELIQLMHEIGTEAEANGLTEDILDEILAES